MRSMKKAFTLIELLTVMAITGVLLTLIVLPIFQSFNILRTAQAFADAQDKGRLLTERIAREVGNAISVRDAAGTIAVVPDGRGGTVQVALPYTKLDLIPPSTGMPEPNSPGVFRDPNTGKIDPTLTRPKGDINLSVVPGATIVRWWVGLNRPADRTGGAIAYNEPYTGLLMPRNGTQDNLYVLRRAEVQPFIYRPRKDGAANSLAWRPNLAYFRSDDRDPNAPTNQDFDTRIIDLDDPYFFVPDGKYLPEGKADVPANRVADADKNNRVLRWSGLSQSNNAYGRISSNVAIQTEVSRYDMIRPLTTGSPAKVVRDAAGAPSLLPLIQFRPTRVAAEPAAGSAAARPGEAVEGIDRIGPDTFRTSRGLWTSALVRFYPAGYAPDVNAGLEIANVDALGGVSISRGISDGSGFDMPATGANDVLFNLKTYEQYLSRGQNYPFTAAARSASAWFQDANLRALFTPFRVLTQTGKIVSSFSIDEVGNPFVARTDPNLPSTLVGSPAMTPVQAGSRPDPNDNTKTILGDPTVASAPLSPLNDVYDINRAYNRLFLSHPDLQGNVQRYLDLRFSRNADGTMPPLSPIWDGGITSFIQAVNGTTVNRVRIVPGSDEVYGPDQNPGQGYGTTVRYTRVTGTPGPNQYRLVYADLPEPTDASGQVTAASYKALLGLTDEEINSGGGFNPAVYDPTNVVSAAIQARFKAGYLQFDSDPNVRMPGAVDRDHPGKITVKYRFQLNGPKDTFAVDLDTREVMQILLTIKNYPQSNVPNAQAITLKSTATLRNALR